MAPRSQSFGPLCLLLAMLLGSGKAESCSGASPSSCAGGTNTDQTELLQHRVAVDAATVSQNLVSDYEQAIDEDDEDEAIDEDDEYADPNDDDPGLTDIPCEDLKTESRCHSGGCTWSGSSCALADTNPDDTNIECPSFQTQSHCSSSGCLWTGDACAEDGTQADALFQDGDLVATGAHEDEMEAANAARWCRRRRVHRRRWGGCSRRRLAPAPKSDLSWAAPADFGTLTGAWMGTGVHKIEFVAKDTDGRYIAGLGGGVHFKMAKFACPSGLRMWNTGRYYTGGPPANAADMYQKYHKGSRTGDNYRFQKGTGFTCAPPTTTTTTLAPAPKSDLPWAAPADFGTLTGAWMGTGVHKIRFVAKDIDGNYIAGLGGGVHFKMAKFACPSGLRIENTGKYYTGGAPANAADMYQKYHKGTTKSSGDNYRFQKGTGFTCESPTTTTAPLTTTTATTAAPAAAAPTPASSKATNKTTLFKSIDLDGDGSIEKDELQKALDAGTITDLFDSLDLDGSGGIIRSELIKALDSGVKKSKSGASAEVPPTTIAPTPSPTTTVPTQAQKDAIVLKHNALRGAMGAGDMTKMKWDDALATAAQQWASGCPSGHSQNRPNSVGENIAWKWATNMQLTANTDFTPSVQAWYDEFTDAGPYKNGGTFSGFGPCTGVCGHYTQVVWAAANKIGCGAAFCPHSTGMAGYELVCQYGSSVPGGYGGNMGGSTLFTKGASCSSCPSGFQTCSQNLCSNGA